MTKTDETVAKRYRSGRVVKCRRCGYMHFDDESCIANERASIKIDEPETSS